MNEVEKLYEKILDNTDWEMEDLDKLLELVYKYGILANKQCSIKILSSVLDNWVHGGDADCIIAEFEEKLNENPEVILNTDGSCELASGKLQFDKYGKYNKEKNYDKTI